ncbi:MAG: hypothetical protein WCF44_16205 [Candidatus Methylophosphatis roskildensis]
MIEALEDVHRFVVGRVGKALEPLKAGLASFVEREIKAAIAASKTLGFSERSLVSAIRDWRNK